ncbi:MAG: hypothetical protein CL844_05575 [Crocinitomicaceae bacterium]|nr:hypothetical protein [Crocinitomicaceae bacterium]
MRQHSHVLVCPGRRELRNAIPRRADTRGDARAKDPGPGRLPLPVLHRAAPERALPGAQCAPGAPEKLRAGPHRPAGDGRGELHRQLYGRHAV